MEDGIVQRLSLGSLQGGGTDIYSFVQLTRDVTRDSSMLRVTSGRMAPES